MDLERAIASLDMHPRRYITNVILPLTGLSFAAAAALFFLLPGIFSGFLAPLPLLLPALALGGAVLYPLTVAGSRGTEMDHNMHYFITHLGTLATAKVPPVELFEQIGGREQEYGALADECEKVASLVLDWNMSLAEACRFVAKRTPSQLFSDFLERFAFAIESGTEMEAFLRDEQEVVMADYETVYEATIKNVENIKTLFNGAMMTLIFLVMFALLMGILIDVSATTILAGLVILSLVIQGAFLVLVHQKVPPDPVWSDQGLKSPLWSQLKYVFPVCVLFTLVLGPALFLLTTFPLPIKVATTFTPLFLPGWMAGQEEAQVKRRDDNYPAFLRSLGSSTAARGGDERAVLKHLRHHDFGPLTDNVRDLFTRLQMRADDELAWDFFTTESGSRLVERFTQMYEEAIEAGGRADEAGSIISGNMVRIVGLRKLRYQEASTFQGMLYGIAAGTAFALFVGLGVLEMLSGLFTDIGNVEEAPVSVPSLINVGEINMPILQAMGLVILLGNAAMSSFLVRIVDGGTPMRGLQDFTVLVWISHVTAWGSGNLMSSFVGGSVSL